MSDQYRVIGDRPVCGVGTGEIVRLDGETVNIPALIAAGHVELVEDKKPAGNKSKAKNEGGSGDDGVQSDGRDDSRS